MDGLVSVSSKIWRELAGYPHWSRDLYLWAITSDMTNGISGIGRAASSLILAELQAQPENGSPTLDAAGLEAACSYLAERGKLLRDGDWYFVVERISYTCLSGTAPNSNYIRSVKNMLDAEKVPASIRRALARRYPTLFTEPEKLMNGAPQPRITKKMAKKERKKYDRNNEAHNARRPDLSADHQPAGKE